MIYKDLLRTLKPSWLMACLVLLMAVACGKKEQPKPEQVVDFTYSGTLRSHSPVTFQSAAPGAHTYSWAFGDGTTSTLPDPTHTYLAAGVYTVSLSATGPNGTASVSKQLSIAAGQPVDFQTGAYLWDNLAVVFQGVAPGATSFQWDFGGGATATGSRPEHQFPAGTHPVTLSVNGPNGTGQIRKNIVVEAAAPIVAGAVGVYTCAKVIVSRTNNVNPPYETTYTRLPPTTVELTNSGGVLMVRAPVVNPATVSYALVSPGPTSTGPAYPHYYFYARGHLPTTYTFGNLFTQQSGDSLLLRIQTPGNAYTVVYHIYGKK